MRSLFMATLIVTFVLGSGMVFAEDSGAATSTETEVVAVDTSTTPASEAVLTVGGCEEQCLSDYIDCKAECHGLPQPFYGLCANQCAGDYMDCLDSCM